MWIWQQVNSNDKTMVRAKASNAELKLKLKLVEDFNKSASRQLSH